MKRLLICLFALLIHTLYSSEILDEYRYLDEIAVRVGADKNSTYHNYTEIYSRYFAPLKEKPIKFLEIGLDRGASVKLWEEYFKNADLHFMDITLKRAEYFSIRSHYHKCDQENQSDLQHFIEITDGNFDIILDDGGHTMNQQLTSLAALFPHVKSGGMYIIEDLHTSYWPQFGGRGNDTTVNFLKSLVDEINYIGATTGQASHRAIPPNIAEGLNIYKKDIFSIHFYDSVAIIIKR